MVRLFLLVLGEVIMVPCLILKVAEALGKVTEHKRALEQAERIEKEFISLMTGQRQSEDDKDISRKNSSSYDVNNHNYYYYAFLLSSNLISHVL